MIQNTAQTATPHQARSDSTDLSVGEILRRTRVHYQRDIVDVEKALRIRAEQIEAIETGNLSALPGRVYAIGFVRSYAEYLGLDGDKIVELFKAQADKQVETPELNFPVPTDEINAPPIWLAVVCFVFCGFMALFLYNVYGKDNDAAEPIPEVTQQIVSVQGPQMPPVAAVEEENNTGEIGTQGFAADSQAGQNASDTLPEKPKGITLNIVSNSWVEIRDTQNQKLISRVLEAGDQYFVPNREGLVMSLGNAGGVEISVAGEKLEALGETGQVLRNIPLDSERLKERFTSVEEPKDIPISLKTQEKIKNNIENGEQTP